MKIAGVRMYQHWISCVKRDGAVQSNEMLAVQPKRYNNPQLLQGFIELSKLSQGQKKIVSFGRLVDKTSKATARR